MTCVLKCSLRRRPTVHRAGHGQQTTYDVFASDRYIGRIMLAPQAPQGAPWFWTITARVPQTTADRGYEATRELAMAAFKAAWERKP